MARSATPLLVLVAGLVLTLTAPPASATPAAGDTERQVVQQAEKRRPVPQLRRAGRWLVDPKGRVVIVHGLNLVWKHAPYAPPDDATGFTAADADWFRAHGFNAARVGTLWAGLTPDAPGRLDPSYVRRTQRVLDLLADRRIWIQLDMHQDQWHEQYGGEGAPGWAAARQLPFSLLPPVVAPFPTGYWTPEVSSMFDDFWADRRGLLTGWTQAWELAATQWRRQPYLMGYDLLNEPWMGAEWTTCLATGCPQSYAAELQPAMERGLEAIRRVDRRNIVWWEPQQFAGGQALDTFYGPVEGEEQLGFSWHSYCPDVFLESQGIPGGDTENCTSFARGRQEHALQQSAEMGAVPMMSEWGATDSVRAIEIDCLNGPAREI